MVKRGYFQKQMEMPLQDIIKKNIRNHLHNYFIQMRYEFATDGIVYPLEKHAIPMVLKVTVVPHRVEKITRLSTNEFLNWVLERLEYYTLMVTGQKQIIVQTKTRFSELPSFAKRKDDSDDYFFFAPKFGMIFQNHHCVRDWILKETIEHFLNGHPSFFLQLFPDDLYIRDTRTGENRIEVFSFGYTNSKAESYERQLASYNTPIFNHNSHLLQRNHLQTINDWIKWTSIINDLDLTPIQEDTAIEVDFPITLINFSSVESFME